LTGCKLLEPEYISTIDLLVKNIVERPLDSAFAFLALGVQSALDSTWLRDPSYSKAEALMNVHVSYRLPKAPAVEKDVQHQIERLQKRLQVFRPDLVHLRGVVEDVSPREGTSVSLNLRLPSGQMAVQSKAPNAAAAVKTAFEDLLQQVNKHKDLLRASHKWQRGRRGNTTRSAAPMREVPFEQTLAAVFPATISSDDVRSYVNANLARLDRFVEREIYFREAQETIAADSVSKEEVIDEAIAAALGDHNEKPEKLALEPCTFSLALQKCYTPG